MVHTCSHIHTCADDRRCTNPHTCAISRARTAPPDRCEWQLAAVAFAVKAWDSSKADEEEMRCSNVAIAYHIACMRVDDVIMMFVCGPHQDESINFQLLYRQFSPLVSTNLPNAKNIPWNRELPNKLCQPCDCKKMFVRILSARTKSETKGKGDCQRAAMSFWDRGW